MYVYRRDRLPRWQPTPVFLPKNPRTEEPGVLQSMGSKRFGHDLVAGNSSYVNTLDIKVLLFVIPTALPIYCLSVNTDNNIIFL